MHYYHVVYASVRDYKNDVGVYGPYYGGSYKEHSDAETRARELANQKTKDVIIPWIIESNRRVPEVLRRARDTWFARFRARLKQSAQMLNRDYKRSSCPFVDVNIRQFIEMNF